MMITTIIAAAIKMTNGRMTVLSPVFTTLEDWAPDVSVPDAFVPPEGDWLFPVVVPAALPFSVVLPGALLIPEAPVVPVLFVPVPWPPEVPVPSEAVPPVVPLLPVVPVVP